MIPPDSRVAEFAEGEVNAYVQGYPPRMASFEDTLFTQVEGAVVVHNIRARTKTCHAGTVLLRAAGRWH